MVATLARRILGLSPSPVALASSLAVASDEIREQFRPPANTLFLHPKQMEVYRSPHRFKVLEAIWVQSGRLCDFGWSTPGSSGSGCRDPRITRANGKA